MKQGKQVDGRFDDRLIEGLAELIDSWRPDPAPRWITWVPSLNHPELVPDLAHRLAEELGVRAIDAVVKVRPTEPQKTMENSAQQLANVQGAFEVRDGIPDDPCLFVDDIVDSRWTLTYTGVLLRQAGCEAVVPVALAESGQS